MQDTARGLNVQYQELEQPKHLDEYFSRLQARYRSEAVCTPSEWPMNTPEGRESYRRSMARERLLKRLNDGGRA